MSKVGSKHVVNILLVVMLTVSSVGFIYFTFFDSSNTGFVSVQSLPNESESFLIKPISGSALDLKTISSKVIVVNFWATWCGPCLIEIPALISLQNTYSHDDLQIIGVSVDDSIDIVKRFSTKSPFNYPITMNSYTISKKFGQIYSIPTTFVLDNDLNIIHKLQGYHQKSTLESLILSLL
tara:strand:- start:1602 stop:2141 length:540 start_codon:yes stop_codon:yes gene_type:complete